MSDRLYPARPILAVSTAVLREGRVLIARRARAPLVGVYAFPGGGVELGETLREAALRELAEECGVEAEIAGFVDHVEPIHREGERVRAHYVIAVFAARWRAREPRITEELDDFRWLEPERVADYRTTPELPRLAVRAAGIVAERP